MRGIVTAVFVMVCGLGPCLPASAAQVEVMILVCSAHLLPQDCQVANAIDVIGGPPAANEMSCGLSAQEYIAQTSLAPDKGDYLKIQCSRAKAIPPSL